MKSKSTVHEIKLSYYIEEDGAVIFGYRCMSLLEIINNIDEVVERVSKHCKRISVDITYFIYVSDDPYDDYVVEVKVKHAEKKRH